MRRGRQARLRRSLDKLRETTRTYLDRVESALKPGEGRLDLGAYVRGNAADFSAGAVADLEAHVNKSMSIFGTGKFGFAKGVGPEWSAVAGMRIRF